MRDEGSGGSGHLDQRLPLLDQCCMPGNGAGQSQRAVGLVIPFPHELYSVLHVRGKLLNSLKKGH